MKKKGKKIFSVLKFWKFILPILIIFIGVSYYYIKDLPSPAKLTSPNTPQSIQIYDRNGELLYTIYRQKDQTFVPLNSIPKYLQQATISIEDKNFYKHGAIDIRGITRATYATLFKKDLQGGSTLTQQLVKNSLLTPERTINRKIKEVILAYATELLYSKDKILEMYLNQTPYGGTAWGAEAAAQTYFGKHAKNLNLAESALLAGLPESPTTYSPFGAHPELAKIRQKEILYAMVKDGYITKEQRDKALKEELRFKKVSNEIKAPHFVLYVKDLLVQKYGERKVEEGGLKIITSLDLKIQEMAEDVVASEVAKLKGSRVSNGAVMITNPSTGEILAMVGSKNYFDKEIDGNVNVTLALRQPGSSIKPINYAVGLMKDHTAATVFIDEKICFPNQGGKAYCPVNYDGKFHGPVQMRFALGNSFNIPAVKMLKVNGIPAMIETSKQMGITTFKDSSKYGLSLTLGGGEVTMLEMTQAFGVFANGGYKIDLQPILKVTNRSDEVLEEYKPPKSPIFGKKVLPEGVAFIISDILADNNARLTSFGPNSKLKISNQIVSVKTGTTDDLRDNWTIGYTPSFVVASWVGNNDNTPMGGLSSGVTGAAPIWHDIITNLLINKRAESLKKPANVIQKAVCSYSGQIKEGENNSECTNRSEYFIKGTESKIFSVKNEQIWVDKDTKQVPPPGKTDNLELKDSQIITDPTGARFCISCPVPTETPKDTPPN
ncbi:penicillin-binding protein [Patescibacteria group bacterium]|nr:penicillin-binding protein [Patescibacteria group bacterium]